VQVRELTADETLEILRARRPRLEHHHAVAIEEDALQAALRSSPQGASERIDGYTENQRFFMNWARVWRGAIRERAQLVSLNTDPHSPAQFRADGAPSDMPAFAAAFSCTPGEPMVRSGAKQVSIW
jgi:putative endopeptidase